MPNEKSARKRKAAASEASPTEPRRAKAPPAAEVTAFMERYGISRRLGRPRERILTWLARASAGLAQLDDPSTLNETIPREALRSTVFHLEGILRLYRRHYDRALEGPYQAAKSLEDALGALGAARHLVELTRRLGLPEPVVDWCETQASYTRSGLVEQLSRHWLPRADGTIAICRAASDTLIALDFEGYSKDRRSLIKEIRSWLHKLAGTQLDMYVLQGNNGLHELRRQLRWLPILAVSLDGLIVTSDERNPIQEYRGFLTSEVAASPYARLPDPIREDRPIEISRSVFLAATSFISELGQLKDQGEEVESLEHALIGGGVAKTSRTAREQALSLLGRTPELQLASQAQAERLYRGLRRNRFFKVLRSDFKG